jgi:divalent metal cation (Fe/Co/Zn/Cd) transporter
VLSVLLRKAGQEARSSVVITNAYQHRYETLKVAIIYNCPCTLTISMNVPRADVGGSLAVLCGIMGTLYGYPLFDPLAGILVSGMIAKQV